jgi:hypothetical protein
MLESSFAIVMKTKEKAEAFAASNTIYIAGDSFRDEGARIKKKKSNWLMM